MKKSYWASKVPAFFCFLFIIRKLLKKQSYTDHTCLQYLSTVVLIINKIDLREDAHLKTARLATNPLYLSPYVWQHTHNIRHTMISNKP